MQGTEACSVVDGTALMQCARVGLGYGVNGGGLSEVSR